MKSLPGVAFLGLALSFFTAGPAFAREATLFERPGQFASLYDQRVQGLQTRDVLRFSNGKVFEIKAVLGEGSTTKVVAISDELALRIPVSSGMIEERDGNTFSAQSYVKSFLDGYLALKQHGVATVEVRVEESLPGEYAVVERVEPLFDLRQFILNEVDLSPEQRQAARTALIEFAATTWAFRQIGDWRGNQVVYTRKGWLLLDWTAEHELARAVDDLMVPLPVDAELLGPIRQKILENRRSHGLPSTRAGRCEDLL